MAWRWRRFLVRVFLRRSASHIERDIDRLRGQRAVLVSRRRLLEPNRPLGAEMQAAYDYHVQIVKVSDQIIELDREISRLQNVTDHGSWH